MEETIIAKAEFSKTNAFTVIAIVLFALAGFAAIGVFGILLLIYGTKNIEYLIGPSFGSAFFLAFFGFITLMSARGIYKISELTITDSKIIGTDAFNRKVELPINQISAIAIGASKTITFLTSSGRISFSWVENLQEIHDCVSKLIQDQQSAKNVPHSNTVSDADEIKKYKELLDSGIITQEEFDAKKRQLLGL